MMSSKPIQILLAIVVLATAMAGGWAATNLFQRTVPLVPGVQGCWRLEGTARQTACLSDEFIDGAGKVAGSTTGTKRDEAVITYVRRAERLAASDSRLAGTCHSAMHELGRTQGRRAAGETRVPTFPGGSSQLCTAGYVHGLAEGYLVSTPSADVVKVFPKLCHDEPSRAGCAHGVGHALLRARTESSYTTATNAALERCSDLPEAFATECNNGVYMELAMRTQPAPVPALQYTQACESASTVERELACWGYLGLSLNSNDVTMAEVPSWCAKAPLPGQYTCIEGYGRDLGVAKVASCEAAATRTGLQQRCIDGAMGLQVGSGHVAPAAARTACRKLRDDGLVSYCDEAVSRYLRGKAEVEQMRS